MALAARVEAWVAGEAQVSLFYGDYFAYDRADGEKMPLWHVARGGVAGKAMGGLSLRVW